MGYSQRGNHDDLVDWLELNPCNSSYTRDEWVKVGQGIHNEGLPFEVFDKWSSHDMRPLGKDGTQHGYDPRACRDTWNSFTKGGGVTGSSVIYELKEHGATPPLQEGTAPAPKRKQQGNNTMIDKAAERSAETEDNTESVKAANLELARAANQNMRDSEAARKLAEPYLMEHVGISVDAAIERNWGVITPDILKGNLAQFSKHYKGHSYLCMTGSGEAAYYHVDRLLLPSEEYGGDWLHWSNGEYKTHKLVKTPNPRNLVKPAIINPEALGAEVVFIVEGLQDQAALQSVGVQAVAMLGTKNVQTVDALIGSETVKAVVMMLDKDEAGRKGTDELRDALAKRNKPFAVFKWGYSPLDGQGKPRFKDAGEWNAHDPQSLAAAVRTAKEEADEAIAEKKNRKWEGLKATTPNLQDWLKKTLGVGTLCFNTATQEVFIEKPLPWDRPNKEVPRPFKWELDNGTVSSEAQRAFNKNVTDGNLRKAIHRVAELHTVDPVAEAIHDLPIVKYNADGSTTFTEKGGESWTVPPLYTEEDLRALGQFRADGEGGYEVRFDGSNPSREKWFPLPRVAGFVLWKILKADITPLTFFAEYIHTSGVIARGLHHGCNYPFALVITGPQGIGKDAYIGATALDPNKYLCDGDFTTMLNDRGKETARAAGKLVLSYQEMAASNNKGSVNKFKSFITETIDSINVKYVPVREVPRSYVIASSSNDTDLLNDPTGNRRFFVVDCHGTVNLADGYGYENLIRLVRGALAEMLGEFSRMGAERFEKRFDIPVSIRRAMEEQAKQFSLVDEEREKINDWLDTCEYDRVCIEMAAVMSGAYSPERWERSSNEEQRKVSNILSKHQGYKKLPKRKELKGYGKRWIWERKPEYR